MRKLHLFQTLICLSVFAACLILLNTTDSDKLNSVDDSCCQFDLFESREEMEAGHLMMTSSYLEDISALPNVMAAGDPFKIYMELNTNTFDSIKIMKRPLGSIQHNGAPVDTVVLVDNGTQGDLIAGDSIYTQGGFSFFAFGSHPLYDQILWRYTDIRYYTGSSYTSESNIDLATSIGVYDTMQVSPSSITPVNDTIQYSDYTINIKRPAKWGENPFPDWNWFKDSDLFYDFFCYDNSYFLVQGTTNNMPLNTGSGATFGPSSNFTEGIGKSLVDLGLPFVGRLTINWTRPMYAYTSHEMLHKWCAQQDLYGSTSGNQGVTGYGHWAYLNMNTSGLVGPTSYEWDSIQHVNQDTFHVWRNYSSSGGYAQRSYWSNLEKYMAGLYPIDSVPFPLVYIKNWELVGPFFPSPITVTGTLDTITQAEWLSEVGSRVPAQGPTEYPTVQVIFSDELLDAGQMGYFDKGFSLSMDTIITNGPSFTQVTGGLVSISSSLFPLNYYEHVTLCSGQDYNGISTPGIYQETLVAANGCDSIVTLEIEVITDDVFGDCCPDNLNAMGDPLTSGTYQAAIEVSSGEIVEVDSSVIFKGENSVQLNPNFEVKAGAEFEVLIDNCFTPE